MVHLLHPHPALGLSEVALPMTVSHCGEGVYVWAKYKQDAFCSLVHVALTGQTLANVHCHSG